MWTFREDAEGRIGTSATELFGRHRFDIVDWCQMRCTHFVVGEAVGFEKHLGESLNLCLDLYFPLVMSVVTRGTDHLKQFFGGICIKVLEMHGGKNLTRKAGREFG